MIRIKLVSASLFAVPTSCVSAIFNLLHFLQYPKRRRRHFQSVAFQKSSFAVSRSIHLLLQSHSIMEDKFPPRKVRALFPEFVLRHRPTESFIQVPRPVRSIVLNVPFCSYVRKFWHPSAVGFLVIAVLIKYHWSTLATVPLNGSPRQLWRHPH
jgi:hypothetical protein